MKLKIRQIGGYSKVEENKLGKIWPLNSEGPQNYSSNGKGLKTLHMYSFYKNTLTADCCFSNLTLLHFSILVGGTLAGKIFWQGGPGWSYRWSPPSQKLLGSSLSPLLPSYFPLQKNSLL